VVTATAPAQEVFISDLLIPDLDWDTLQLTEVEFGEQVIVPGPDNDQYYTQIPILDYRQEITKPWSLDITIQLDHMTGMTNWTFRTLDPETGLLPEDPLAGFLPPNDSSGRGEGHVSFSILPRSNTAVGSVITNSARIVFDINEPIYTNPITNTLGIPPNRTLYLPLVIRSW